MALAAGAEGASAPLSDDARALVAAVVAARDHGARPFAVIDKRLARLWVLDARARVVGSAPVLLGLAAGDDSVPGIGERPLAQIRPEERTTPAGRFELEPGRNTRGDHILWVDYEAAVSMHRVRPTVAAERRLQRLASATPADNRISFGCINVPASFYDQVVWPTFSRRPGVVYVLPEWRKPAQVFPQLLPSAE
ncbi:L,D-transpeptidase [Rubrivivax gelatinosus]|uniref:L,D-transpeptidase n=1 Tax=Rubrivivax gelatinosus TaxID=28068 RepID=A0ABS1DPN4_RUBGE|nr:L,D-transpeptidase [Rubrivivax gelatinosus]MBK1711349.1 L,D-transpeptidase [Rubrivivax gelatinosus]